MEKTIHLLHFLDSYPLCWSMDQDGEYDGSYEKSEVTCFHCILYME